MKLAGTREYSASIWTDRHKARDSRRQESRKQPGRSDPDKSALSARPLAFLLPASKLELEDSVLSLHIDRLDTMLFGLDAISSV